MIILEGPDCSGKTTLANVLYSKIAQCRLTHYSSHDFPKMLRHAVMSFNGMSDISDRFHLSHIPYDRYYRKTEPEILTVRMLDRVLLANNSLVILCIPPWEVVRDQWMARRDQELIKDMATMRNIYDWYSDYEPVLPHIRYDYTEMCTSKLYKEITLTRSYNINRSTPNMGAGNSAPGNILLVGERCSSEAQLTIPFIGQNNSGSWLTEQLEAADICESELYWINVHKPDGSSNLKNVQEVITQQLPSVICSLGGIASQVLESLDVNFEPFAHPQYWKRFKHKYEYPLITFLKEFLDEQDTADS